MSNFNTAYDDVFRTLLVDCRELIIPIVNEVFHTNYIGTESVVLHENEIFMRQQDGEEEKVVTDSSFAIISFTGETKREHTRFIRNSDTHAKWKYILSCAYIKSTTV